VGPAQNIGLTSKPTLRCRRTHSCKKARIENRQTKARAERNDGSAKPDFPKKQSNPLGLQVARRSAIAPTRNLLILFCIIALPAAILNSASVAPIVINRRPLS
jgi:hypothetical protein